MDESILEKLKSLPVLIGATVVAVLIIGFTAWRVFGPQTNGLPSRSLTTEEKANKTWIEDKVRETGGDFTKLSPEDQRRLIALNGPQAPFNFRQMAQSLGQK